MQKQGQLWAQGGGELKLGGKGVFLDLLRAVVQAIIVKAELAKSDEGRWCFGLGGRACRRLRTSADPR